jgi:hypothetical protein
MKTPILIFTLLFTAGLGCKSDAPCTTDDFEPNEFKYYLPYTSDELIEFKDSFGQKDTLIVISYALTSNRYPSMDCFLQSESLDVKMAPASSGSTKLCSMTFHSALARAMPKLIIEGSGCGFQAGFEDYIGNARISEMTNFSWGGLVYPEVLLVNRKDQSSVLEEMVLAKNIGFLYIKIHETVLTAAH